MSSALEKALRVAVSQTERNPTDAQKEAGNYAKGKLSWNGLQIAIENPKGGTRSGVDKGGKRWSVRLPASYGYFLGTEGKDGDHVDTYVGSDHGSQKVFIVDQVDAESGRFDEHKVMLAYSSKAAALADYEKAFSDGKAKDRIGAVTEMGLDAFKDWLRSGNTKKPLGDIRKGYASGGAVMSSRNNGPSPADRALGHYADGGVPDWRSDIEARGPGYDPRRGEVRDERKPDILREVRPSAERALDAVLDYGSVPARTAVGMAMEPMTAISEAYDDPSLANVTNAGVQGALALSPFAPARALKAAIGAASTGLGIGAARDLAPSLLGPAQAEGDGLSPAQRTRLQQLQRKKSLSRAEREEQNALIGIQGRFQELQARQQFEAQARRDAALVEAESKRKESDRVEYDAAVGRAEKARAEELSKYTPFKDTAMGEVYNKLGIAAPVPFAAGAGLIGRTAARLGGKSGLMTELVAPAATGAATAGVMANYPLMHDLVFAPAENPEKRAYQAYSRELPVGHPRKEEMRDYAAGLPTENPTREAASREMYDPQKFAERTGIGVLEGLVSGPFGAHLSKIGEKLPGTLAALPGELGATYYGGMEKAAKARAKAIKANQSGERLLDSGAELRRIEPELRRAGSALEDGTAEARRRSSAPGAASGLSEPPPPPRQSPASEVVPSPASDSPPVRSTSKRSAPRVKKQDALDPKALKAEIAADLARAPSGDPKSVWGLAPKGIDEVLDSPEVIMLTKDKLGRKQFRTTEGRYRGGPVTKSTSKPSMLNRALDVARKFANGGAVTVGPVVGHTGGREDAKPVDVAAGSFVIPADVVSSLGTGNSLAGMEHLKKVFGEPVTRASGGAVPILISDGEYVISPEQVEKIGGGDMKKGHAILDAMVLKLRKQHIDTLKSLPGPAKGHE